MEVLENYRELIEADSNTISICWKLIPMILYFLSAISGYVAAVLFYILWHDIFAGNCPLWGEIVSQIRRRVMPDNVPIEVIPTPATSDWRRKIFVAFKHESRCELYYFVSLCSCFFGIAWLMLFSMCGKGGYDTRIFVQPWRVVPPAIIFQLIFTILTMIVVNDLEHGYAQFATNLQKVAYHINETEMGTRKRKCEVMQHFFEIYGINDYSICTLYPALQIFSWIMAISWALGLIVLTLRVISINDFNLLTVTVQKIPKDQVHKYMHKNLTISGSTESVREETK